MKAYLCPCCCNRIAIIGDCVPFCGKCKLQMFPDTRSKDNKPDKEFKPRKLKKKKKKK